MARRKLFIHVLVLVLIAGLTGPAADAAKKKKPKPYKSEEHALAVSHTMLSSSTGDRNNVTLKEFETRCAIPTTQGFDGVVYEVPKEYQTIQSSVAARSDATTSYALYFVMYDKDCKFMLYIAPNTGVPNNADTEGIMPAGVAYVGLANFAGEPANVWWEAKV